MDPEVMTPKSPVPLNREEAQNAEVRALAEKLAPALEEADALLVVPKEFQTRATSQDLSTAGSEDDSMDDELDHLRMSEALLRQELELASDFSNLFQFDSPTQSDPKANLFGGGEDLPEQATHEPQLPVTLSPTQEADGQDEGEPLTLDPIRLPSPLASSSNLNKKTQSISAEVDNPKDSAVLLTAGPLDVPTSNPLHPYTYKEHFERLQISLHHGWYNRDVSKHLTGATPGSVRDYCLTLPESKLKSCWIGLKPEPDSKDKKSGNNSSTNNRSSGSGLPVRTLSIAVRPDVLCGAVMDGVHQALSSGLQARILKRQGGHLRGVVAGCVVPPPERLVEGSASERSDEEPAPIEFPAFTIDAQLCTTKSEDCERVLVIRIYHVSEQDENDEDIGTAMSPDTQPDGQRSLGTHHFALTPDLDARPANLLRESCALVQRLEAPESNKKIRSPPRRLADRESMQQTVSQHLLQHYRACPSSKKGNVTLPVLNNTDWPVILSSCRLVPVVWDELETRDLTMSTLQTCRFGAFPALPTLDVHYCSQIRRYSRELMIMQLLKSASELEEYARTAEYNCANMINLLSPTYAAYDLETPSLPQPVPLNEYPLEFIPPQQTCPPWGGKVMEALNQIQAMCADTNDDATNESVELAEQAVRRVLQAFAVQDDEEKGARLGRKNMQVMDRLAKMQAHQRTLIQTLQNGRALSPKAKQASLDFRSKAGEQHVPLLKWGIVVGNSTGTLLVSVHLLCFCTQLIPIVGGTTTKVFSLRDVNFVVEETTPSLMNPLPTLVHVIDRQGSEEKLAFRPSTGGVRLVNVLRSIQETMENADSSPSPPSSPAI